MKSIQHFITLLIIALTLVSCSTSNKVVSGNFIQKRKYTKGFYINKKEEVNKTNVRETADKTIHRTNSQKDESCLAHQKKSNRGVEKKEHSFAVTTDDHVFPPEGSLGSTSDNYTTTINKKTAQKTEKTPDNSESKRLKSEKKITDTDSEDDEEPLINILGFLSFIIIIPPFTYFGIIFSLLIGAFALRQFKRNPGKYKFKWMAIVGVIFGYLIWSTVFVFIVIMLSESFVWGGFVIGMFPLIYLVSSTVIILSK